MESSLLNESLAVRVWSEADRRIKACKEITENNYQQWFRGLVPLNAADRTLTLGVPDDVFALWLEENFGSVLRESLADIGGVSYRYRLESGHELLRDTAEAEPPVTAAVPQTETPMQFKRPPMSNCLKTHTFDNFVVGEENRFAYVATKTAAETPGLYNPLYIYGGTGVGKTHLLQAVAFSMVSRSPGARVKFATCEELLNTFVNLVMQRKSLSEFRSSLRDVDALLVDDVHILANKTQLQEEFFNTFNALHNLNKQIILTSDKQPCEIEGLEPRLVSRFESGMSAELFAPGPEARLAILRMMREDSLIKVRLDDSVLEFLARNISSSVRRLKGAFIRLITYASAMNLPQVTVNEAEQLLHTLLERECSTRNLLIEDIQRAVADHFSLKLSDLLGSKRPRHIAEPRMVAMYLSRRMTKHSLPEIGDAFGKNHATILNAVRKIPELMERDAELRRAVGELEHQLRKP